MTWTYSGERIKVLLGIVFLALHLPHVCGYFPVFWIYRLVKQGDGDPSLCARNWRIELKLEAPVQKLPKHQQICVDDGLGLTSPPLKAFSSFSCNRKKVSGSFCSNTPS